MLGLPLRLEGVSYFMTGTRDLASTTPNYCFDKSGMVHPRIWEKFSQRWELRTSLMKGSARHAKWTLKIVSQVCLTSYPIIQSNSLPDGDWWTTQLPSSAVWPGGTNNSKRPIHRCRECGPPVYRSELQHMEAEMRSSESAYPSPLLLILGVSRVVEVYPLSRSRVPEPILCVQVSPTISSKYLSNSCTSSSPR